MFNYQVVLYLSIFYFLFGLYLIADDLRSLCLFFVFYLFIVYFLLTYYYVFTIACSLFII